ncbi:hypothetical protein C7212DRAFT_360807 [Tuber magnatum]|uniref:Uncharacterized protein n=1 Tax=Tuber magnatum TaxID=42249 RepID=A0A317SY48_9PEZI|nr:hypothetical protein C7212DRAFT_360807 [Tuber magnatum]
MDFPLPQVQSSLKPYIQTPSEATYIRQVVSQHLTNLSLEKRTTSGVGSRDEFRRFLDFELGRGGGGGNSRCIRKEYLEALREEAEARKALEAEDVETDPDDEEEAEGEEEEGNRWIEEYTSTLSLTRQFEKLEILQIYLRTFNDPAVLEAEEKHKILFNDPPPNPPAGLTAVIVARGSGNGPASAGGNGGGITEELSTRLLTLEKTILATHNSLQWETERLRELQRNGQEEGGVRRGSRKEAFAQTRDALITWVESQLSHTATIDGPDAPTALSAPTDGGEVLGTGGRREKTSLEGILEDINASYEEYLSARREVVEVLSAVTQTLTQPIPITTPHPGSTPAGAGAATKTPSLTPPLPPPPILKVLSAVEQLIPLINSQKALISQKTFFLSALASRQKSFLTALEEKADDNDTFTIATAGARSGGSSASVQLAKRIADRETVRVEKFGKEAAGYVRSAGGTLEDVYALLAEVEGLVVRRKGKKMEKEGETKIPVRRKGRRRVPEEEVEVEKGFWGTIAGNVGVIGDGI